MNTTITKVYLSSHLNGLQENNNHGTQEKEGPRLKVRKKIEAVSGVERVKKMPQYNFRRKQKRNPVPQGPSCREEEKSANQIEAESINRKSRTNQQKIKSGRSSIKIHRSRIQGASGRKQKSVVKLHLITTRRSTWLLVVMRDNCKSKESEIARSSSSVGIMVPNQHARKR